MTSPSYLTSGTDPTMRYAQGGFGDPQFDRDQAARMYDLQTQMKVKELEQQYRISKDEIGARLKIAGQQSRDTRYGIDSQRDSEREKLAHLKDEMERIGIPRMLIEKYVAEKTYEIALAEMSLKRDVFVEETAQAREKLKLEREEMERIGIPDMEIRRYVAQQEAAIARGQLGLQEGELTGYYGGQSTLSRDQFRSDAEFQRAQLAEQQRQYDIGASGYMAPRGGTLAPEQQARYQQIRARDEQLRAAGQPGVTAEERAELAGYEDVLSGRAGGGMGQATLEREEMDRRYGLDVAKFGAELASTPDTYFQGRRFQGVDIPRLMGGAGAATSDVAGGPTPGVATMGAYLSGQDPYGPQRGALEAGDVAGGWGTGGPTADVDPSVQRGMPGSGGPVGDPTAGRRTDAAAPLSPQEQARYQQLVARRQQTGGVLDPVDEDELQRFQARMGVGATYNDPAFGGGHLGGGPIDQYGAPIGGGGGMPGWYTGGPTGGSEDGWRGITDPGYGPSSDPYGDRMRALGGGGGIPGMGGPSGGMLGGPIDQYGAPLGGGGGGFENIDPVSGGSTLPHSSYGGGGLNTQSVYGGPAVSASVGPQGYYQPRRPSRPSPYPSQDPRQKQLAALAKALPPSPFDGLNEQDSAALKAMESIYKGGGNQVAGGELERLKASGRYGFMQSAGRLLGYDPKEFEAQYQSYRPSQGSSRLAG